MRSISFFLTSLVLSTFSFASAAADCPAFRAKEVPALPPEAWTERMILFDPNDYPEVNIEGMNEQGPHGRILLAVLRGTQSGVQGRIVRFEKNAKNHLDVKTGEMVVRSEDWKCILAAGDPIYVSDGFTDHAVSIYDIDYEREIVWLWDPGADKSFFLSENALFEDYGGTWQQKTGYKIVVLPFASLESTIKLSILFPHGNEPIMRYFRSRRSDHKIEEFLYWNYYGSFADVDLASPGSLGYSFPALLADVPLDVPHPLWVTLSSYLKVLFEIRRVRELPESETAQGVQFTEGFFDWLTHCHEHCSREMGIRVLRDLGDAKLRRLQIMFAARRQMSVGIGIDEEIFFVDALHHAGKEDEIEYSDSLLLRVSDEFNIRLAQMFRGASHEENMRILHETEYLNNSIRLMRYRVQQIGKLSARRLQMAERARQ